MPLHIGLDFGTTNSVLTLADEKGNLRTARFKTDEALTQTFRSILCFWEERGKPHHAEGPWAIDEYLKDPEGSRLIQSVKSYLASANFTETRIFGQKYTLEDLIALILRSLWQHAAQDLGLPETPPADAIIMAGRPVDFVGTNPNNDFAQKRLQQSYKNAGFSEISFAFEPQGAAWFHAQQSKKDERLLVADFGGGTSDFSLVEVQHKGGRAQITPLGHGGVGVAGDAFDYRIIEHLICPQLGKGSTYESFGKTMEMPLHYYHSFSAWHLMSMMNTPKTLRELETIAQTSAVPEKLETLAHIIRGELGFKLYKSVATAKADLSHTDRTILDFKADGIHLTGKLTRKDFEKWIAPDLKKISAALDDLLKKTGQGPSDIGKVFLTGGTSFVPAIRHLIEERFGADKIASGEEFTSVSAGLALMAHTRHN